MHALTVMIIAGGEPAVLRGTLFPTPAELLTKEQVRRYSVAPNGWSRCPLNFSIYAVGAPDGSRIVVPGIILPNIKPKRKLPNYRVEFLQEQIEDFVQSIVEERSRVKEATATELQALTHDIRALSAEIYAAADLVKSDIAQRQMTSAAYRIDTVIAAQQMLSLRLDIVDFSTGQFLSQDSERIPVYKKVHKAVNCLKPKAISSNLNLIFQGPSAGIAYGPPIFELIPFVVLQNAIKYSPPDNDITVKVSDFDTKVDVHVQSLGPKIQNAEVEKIFERGYRGIEAKKSGIPGSGIGLFAAQALTREGFGGTLTVVQDSFPAIIDHKEFYRTTFSLALPRAA